jgi:hypothetical protein
VGLLLCTRGLFSGQGSYVVGLLLCTGGLFSVLGSFVESMLLFNGGLCSGLGNYVVVTVFRWFVWWIGQLCCWFVTVSRWVV